MKYILILIISCLGLSNAFCQEENKAYLFPDFTEGYVYYKDGRVFSVPLNYDLLKQKFFFIDKDKEKKEFSEPNMITSIKIGERVFMPVPGKEVAEVIQLGPTILVQYIGSKKVKKALTYGGRTETASVDSYNNLIYSTGDYESSTFLGKIHHEFYIEKNKRLKKFSTEKQFLKIFPKQKEQLKQYIKENKIDFNSKEDVIKLCNYADSL